MEEPVVTLHNPLVSLDFETGDMEIRGLLRWDAGPYPEVVWISAYFLNPEEARYGPNSSRSNPPIKLLRPVRQGESAEIIARGHFHWWNNSDAPRDGYIAKVTVAAASSEAAQVPVRSRDYSAVDAVPVEILGPKLPVMKSDTKRAVARQQKAQVPRPASTKSPTARSEYDVALSFAGEDRKYVERVATLLKESAIKVFYDKFEEVELWGLDLSDHLADVYARRSRWVVLFVSAHYAAKAWPNHERKHALARAIEQQKNSILPARFDDTVLPGLPATIAYVDLRITSPEKLASMIVEKVRSDPGESGRT